MTSGALFPDEVREKFPASMPQWVREAYDGFGNFWPRKVVEHICDLKTKDERNEALKQLPGNFDGMVRIMVERAFYNRSIAARQT